MTDAKDLCCICTELHTNKTSVTLICGHPIHRNCLSGMFKKCDSSIRNKCPLCRHSLYKLCETDCICHTHNKRDKSLMLYPHSAHNIRKILKNIERSINANIKLNRIINHCINILEDDDQINISDTDSDSDSVYESVSDSDDSDRYEQRSRSRSPVRRRLFEPNARRIPLPDRALDSPRTSDV